MSYFVALATILTITPNALRKASTVGFKVIFPATTAVITALPATTWQIRFLSLVAAVQLFVAVMFFVVVGVKVFQHVPRSFGQGCVDVVEVENVFSVSQPLVLDKKLETLRAPKIKHQTKP